MAGYLAELVAPPKMELFGILPSCFRETEALMHALANLDDSYIPRTSELIRIEFAVRERGQLCAPGSADSGACIRDRAGGETRRNQRAGATSVSSGCLSPSGNWIAEPTWGQFQESDKGEKLRGTPERNATRPLAQRAREKESAALRRTGDADFLVGSPDRAARPDNGRLHRGRHGFHFPASHPFPALTAGGQSDFKALWF
jgi:hypothetical protein